MCQVTVVILDSQFSGCKVLFVGLQASFGDGAIHIAVFIGLLVGNDDDIVVVT